MCFLLSIHEFTVLARPFTWSNVALGNNQPLL